MDDRFGPCEFQPSLDGCGIGDVEVEIRGRDLEALVDEPWNQMSTDKAPRARDENPHRPQTARLDNALLAGC